MDFRQIDHASPEYRQECELRDAVLRRPLGLALSARDVDGEDQQLHFGLFDRDRLLASVIAVPQGDGRVKVRQMVVAADLQGRGLGRDLMIRLEGVLAARGFTQLWLHARLAVAPFYQKLGYARTGDVFLEVGLPHVLMEKSCPASDACVFKILEIGLYPAVLELMGQSPGVAVRGADSIEGMERYLRRNPGLSHIALSGDRVVGCAMAGHDGRRGYLQHVVVAPSHRGRGIAAELVALCLAALKKEGIEKVHLDVFADNADALRYWSARGWIRREDLVRFSTILGADKNV